MKVHDINRHYGEARHRSSATAGSSNYLGAGHSRRTFVRYMGSLAAAGLAVPAWIGCRAPSEKADAYRNVIFLISDDHAATVAGCYGNPIVRTPNIDRLAERGIRFEKAYANAPLCSASRQSLITGKFPHAAGVTLLRTSFPEEQVTIAEHLKGLGFATGLIGKAHFNNDLSHGFDYRVTRADHRAYVEALPDSEIPKDVPVRPPWRPFRDHARVWLNADRLPSSNYDRHSQGTYYSTQANAFIDAHNDERFFLVVGYHEPHSPFNFPVEYAGRYRPEDMPLPTGSPEDDRWIPLEFKDLTEQERRGIIASYYTSVEYMDKNVGLVVDHLAAKGLIDETLVVYLGDHGYLLNDHKRFEKHMMWEPAVRSPLILAGAADLGGGAVSEAMTEFVDIAPTVLDLLDVPAMEGLQGESLVPVIEGRVSEHKTYVFSEFLADNKAMVRTEEWKYIFTSGKRDLGQGYETGNPPPGVTHRLYHMPTDPDEHRNVAGLPENGTVLEQLQGLMLAHFQRTHPKSDRLPDGLTIEEALVWFCEPPEIEADLEAR